MPTVSSADLREALRDALPFLPRSARRRKVLRLRTTETHLIVSATDLYTYARFRMPLREADALDLWLNPDDVRAFLPSLTGDGEVSLTETTDGLMLTHGGVTVLLAPTAEIVPDPDAFENSLLTDLVKCDAAELTVDLLRARLPRRAGAKSACQLFHNAKCLLIADDTPERRWLIAVMPRQPAVALRDQYQQITAEWRH